MACEKIAQIGLCRVKVKTSFLTHSAKAFVSCDCSISVLLPLWECYRGSSEHADNGVFTIGLLSTLQRAVFLCHEIDWTLPAPSQTNKNKAQQLLKHFFDSWVICTFMFSESTKQKLRVATRCVENFHSHKHFWSYGCSLKCTGSSVKRISLPAKLLLLQRHLEGACVCVCITCAFSWARHGSGTFQGEGKDFPGSGNLAQDKYAGEAARIFLLEFQFRSWGCYNWVTPKTNSNRGGVSGIFVCALLRYNYRLPTLSTRAPTCTTNSLLIHCTQDKPTHLSSAQSTHTAAHAAAQHQHLWAGRNSAADLFPRRHMQSLCRRFSYVSINVQWMSAVIN